MSQFEPDGRVFAPPVKSSAKTVVQPDSGGGIDAAAGKVSGIAMSTAPSTAPRASLREWGIGYDLLDVRICCRSQQSPFTRRPDAPRQLQRRYAGRVIQVTRFARKYSTGHRFSEAEA